MDDFHSRPEYPLNSSVFFLDLYRLAAVFLASRGFRAAGGVPFHKDALGMLAAYNEHDEVIRILVSSAVWIRVFLDQDQGLAPDPVASVGQLSVDPDSPPSPLSLREACNKIIHATRYTLVTASDEPESTPYLTGEIEFFGTRHDKPWKATVNAFAFVRAANVAA